MKKKERKTKRNFLRYANRKCYTQQQLYRLFSCENENSIYFSFFCCVLERSIEDKNKIKNKNTIYTVGFMCVYVFFFLRFFSAHYRHHSTQNNVSIQDET